MTNLIEKITELRDKKRREHIIIFDLLKQETNDTDVIALTVKKNELERFIAELNVILMEDK